MASIKDIARRAGVSVTTVSLVLNNKGSISEETRSRVMEIVREMNYTRNTQARNLRNQETRVIGYSQQAHVDQENVIYSTFLQQISIQLEETNRYILFFNEKSEDDLETYEKLIASQRVDGFILSYTRQNDVRFHYLVDQNVPFVVFGRSLTPADAKTHWVDVDNELGMYSVTQHLLERGHRRIGIIGWEEGSWVSGLRVQGYQRALAEAGIPYDPALLARTEDSAAQGHECARSLMQLADPPTAICATSDILAAGVLRYIQENGLRVAVTGYDDHPISRLTNPALTTVHQPLAQVAQKIAELMIDQLDNKNIRQRSYMFAPELIVRESSDFSIST